MVDETCFCFFCMGKTKATRMTFRSSSPINLYGVSCILTRVTSGRWACFSGQTLQDILKVTPAYVASRGLGEIDETGRVK